MDLSVILSLHLVMWPSSSLSAVIWFVLVLSFFFADLNSFPCSTISLMIFIFYFRMSSLCFFEVVLLSSATSISSLFVLISKFFYFFMRFRVSYDSLLMSSSGTAVRSLFKRADQTGTPGILLVGEFIWRDSAILCRTGLVQVGSVFSNVLQGCCFHPSPAVKELLLRGGTWIRKLS